MEFISNLEESIQKLSTNEQLLIAGDFNAHHVDWLESDDTDTCGELLSELFNTYSLDQIVHFPTNLHLGKLKGCIDLIATNISQINLTSSSPLGKSDPVVLIGTISNLVPSMKPSRYIWCWNKANVHGLQEAISKESWCDILDCEDVDIAWTRWRAKILYYAHKFIPRYLTNSTIKPHPWMSDDLRQEIKAKHRLYKTFKRTQSSVIWEEFRKQRNRVCKLLKVAKSHYVQGFSDQLPQTLGERSTSHTPNLHTLLRLLLRGKNSCFIPNLRCPDGSMASTDMEKAETFNQFFVSQNRQSAQPGPLPFIPATSLTSKLCEFNIEISEVERHLSTLDVKKATGDDGVLTRLLRLLSKNISRCVHHLFCLSLKSGELPQDWKQATVIPIYKKGDHSLPSNYRPISLLSILSKVLEIIIFQHLYRHVNPIIPMNQSGFRKKDGTALQLARIVHSLSEALEKKNAVVSCFFDLTKAFDRVWHKGLLAKLEHLGIGGSLLRWLTNYLENRTQRVRIGKVVSSWQGIKAGVPQGSVLGPLLFIIYTHDLPQHIFPPVDCNMFADDTALCSVTNLLMQSVRSLQVSTSVGKWLSDWRLSVNLSKTTVMITSRNLPTNYSDTAPIYLYGEPLPRASQQRHLGIIISADLRWSHHISHILNKARRLLGVLKRLRSSLSQQGLLRFTKHIFARFSNTPI